MNYTGEVSSSTYEIQMHTMVFIIIIDGSAAHCQALATFRFLNPIQNR
jgi:hypothetical protein